MILNEHTTSVKWFKVHGVPKELDKLAIYEDDIYLPIESLNLTPANFVAFLVEQEEGSALVGKDNRIYVSGSTAIRMAEISSHPDLEEFKKCLSRLYDKTLAAEIIQNPVVDNL